MPTFSSPAGKKWTGERPALTVPQALLHLYGEKQRLRIVSRAPKGSCFCKGAGAKSREQDEKAREGVGRRQGDKDKKVLKAADGSVRWGWSWPQLLPSYPGRRKAQCSWKGGSGDTWARCPEIEKPLNNCHHPSWKSDLLCSSVILTIIKKASGGSQAALGPLGGGQGRGWREGSQPAPSRVQVDRKC